MNARTASHLSPALLVLGLVPSLARAQQGPPPAPVRVDAAVLQELQEMRRISGQIRAQRRSLVATREPGLVLEVLVREGQRVQEGEVMARIDKAQLERDRSVLAAEELLARAIETERNASLRQAGSDLEALRALAERNAVNPKELGDAETAHAIAAARLLQAKQEIAVLDARRDQLEQRLADTEPVAPFTGTIVARHAQAGAWVGVGGPIVELVSSDELEAWLDVPQSWFGPLTGSDEPLWIDVDARDQAILVESWRVLPDVNPRGRVFPVIARLGEGSGLAPGMSVTASVPTGELSEYLTIARDAVLRSEIGAYVYVARSTTPEAPPIAAMAPIEVLFTAGERVAVRSPALAPGDLVVVEGNERLFPSAPLAPSGGEQR